MGLNLHPDRRRAIGWISLLRGIIMLLVTTEQQRQLIEFWRKDTTFYVAVALMLVLGGYLARAGFAA